MGSENRKKTYEREKINKKSNTEISKKSSNLRALKFVVAFQAEGSPLSLAPRIKVRWKMRT